MRRFLLVGVALMLLTGSASAQVYNVTTIKNDRGKITIIEKVVPPTLDQLSLMPPPCPPKTPPCCLLPDQPALLYRLAVMNALHTTNVGGMGVLPRLDDLPRPALLDDKKPIAEEKKVDEKKDGKDIVPERPFPAAMITLTLTDWYCGRCFTDDCGRQWCLLKGCPLPEKQPHLRGWLLESDLKKMYFVHETGNIYTRVGVTPAP